MTEEPSILDFWTENEKAYHNSTKKIAEQLERGRIYQKALFTRPHRDIALYCAQHNGADAETLKARFGNETPKLLDELATDGIVVVKDSTYQISDHIRQLYKNYKFLK